MIKANELRVGNLVYNVMGKPISVDWGNIKWSKDVEPIPITESWLLKLGFEKLISQDFDMVLKISAAKLYVRSFANHYYFQFNETYFGEIFPNVHQLQNFCMIFGKELEIK